MAPPSPKDRASLRVLVLPETVLSMAVLILAFAVGTGVSRVVFYSYYEFQGRHDRATGGHLPQGRINS